ncbi:MAG: hypothetical protein IT458_02205 [Planctomycetes bacterium]|nr:hypothetical protein [Planctomycetota bacterium]
MPGSANETTTFSPGLIGFYLAVGFAMLGGCVGAIGVFLLEESDARTPVLVVGCAMFVLGFLGSIRFLKAARHET